MTGTTGTPAVHTLQADSVVFRRGGRTILDRVTVTATAGRVLAVTGPSGAGKSTLLACLAGLTAPTEGQITVDGRPLTVGDDQPQIVIADEPTAELDTDTRNTILQLLRDHASRGAAVIIATHDPEVTELADDEIGLRDGRTAAMPSPMDIRR